MAKTDDYINVSDAAEASGLSRATIFRMIAADHLNSWTMKGDRKTYVSKTALKKLMGPKEKK